MLDPELLSAEFADIVQGSDGTSLIGLILGEAYQRYSMEATAFGVAFHSGDSTLLEEAFSCSNDPRDIDKMADRICRYWQGLVHPGSPSHGGTSVVSVQPSFLGAIPAMKSAIASCITTIETPNAYARLFYAMESVLNATSIVVVELMPTSPPTPMSFTVYLS